MKTTLSFKKIGLILFAGLSLSTQSFAGKDDLPLEIWTEVFNHLGYKMGSAALVCTDFAEAVKVTDLATARTKLLQEWPGYAAFEQQFKNIPAGYLPGRIQVQAFEANSFVTRGVWNEIMGGKPVHFPGKQEEWDQCLNCPVTHVAYEEDATQHYAPAEVQTFLTRLNQKTVKSRCTYDLPSDHQLWYSIRGDQTGNNQDLYSAGVTDLNVDQYVTHNGNAIGGPAGPQKRQVQPIGQRKLNNFGIELGNVSRMSKDPHNADPAYGRSMRGGSWSARVDDAESRVRLGAYTGSRLSFVGFSLVRTCR